MTNNNTNTKWKDLEDKKRIFNSSSRFVDSIGILKIIFLLLLLVMVFRSLSGVNSISFTSFLTWLRDFHPLLQNFSFVDLSIVGDWGIFNFFKDFLNIFMQVISVAVFVCKAIVNFISYVFGFVRFLFLF